MKKFIYNSLLLLAAVSFASGCIKETFPEGSTVTSQQVASSPSALQALINSIPAAMVTTGTAGYLSNYSHHGDFGIGEIHLITENMLEDFATLAENPFYNRNYFWGMCYAQGPTSWPCAYFWDCYYPWIKTCNDVISSVLSAGEPTATTAPILGTAYAYRAAFYLDLARLYEPKPNKYIDVSKVAGLTVPIVDENTTEAVANNNPRATREKMYEFILSDLKNAETYLAKAPILTNTPSIDVVNGLYARAYLEMGAAGVAGAYKSAADYASKVITCGRYAPLTKAQWEDPVNGFNNMKSQTSWVWGVGISPENFNNICTYAAFICSEGQWGYAPLAQYGASKRFYEAIPASDFRKYQFVDPTKTAFYDYKFAGTAEDAAGFLNGNSNVPPVAAYESIKFRPGSGNCTDYNIGNAVDQPLMRVEEMYFIEMEALAMDNQLPEAKNKLKAFMDKRILDGSYTCLASDTAAFLEEMLFQKRVEFWGEGVLMYDYKRLDHGITRGYKGTNWPADFCFNSEGRSPEWNIVITRAEVQVNNGISEEQNNPDPSDFTPLWVEE